MAHIINSQLVVAASHCPRKACFLLRGDPVPRPHEYEQVVEERETRDRAEYLSAKKGGNSRTVVAGDLTAECDAVESSSHNRREPHLIIGTHTPTSSDKLRLAFAGYTIGEQGRSRPTSGVFVLHGEAPKRVKLETLYPTVRRIVANLRNLMSDLPPQPPALSMGKHCLTCEFQEHCSAEAERIDSLFLLDKMTPKLVAKYNKKGILTLTQISYVFRPRRRRKNAGNLPTPFNVELQALAIRTKKIYLHERPALPQHPVELFLDIEGIPDQGFDYLIGVLVKEGEKTTMHSFWADTVEEESRIFKECLDVAAKYPNAPIYHYGSYERHAFERVAKQQGIDCEDSLRQMVNVNGPIYGKVYFPTRSNKLKDLGVAVGASWTMPKPSGIQSIVWRYRWEDTGDNDFKTTLFSYNQADCHALRLLTAELQSLSNAADSRLDVDFTNKPKQLCTPMGEQLHRVFDGILASTHEEYKRKKIELSGLVVSRKVAPQPTRTKKTIRQRKILHRPSKTITVPRRRKCLDHPAITLRPSRQISEHTLIDLAFTRLGCRKKIVKYVGKMAYCPQCNHLYSPPAIRRLTHRIYGHSFQACAVYQRIVLRLPLAAIEQSCEMLFAEHVSSTTVDGFIDRFAAEYAHTEEFLRTHILRSPIVHVDETKINIQGTNQYVFVLTDGRHVVFRLSPTRETALIKDILQGYGGVLISDFYGGYDSMNCRQQKCWSHLIRDLNDDLWKNPFLEEYEQFVVHVRDLILPIFQDVLTFGLKRRHLQKHLKHVERFYRQHIEGAASSCEIVRTYQKRFVKYRESLFLFLTEDGIPWNNNMAERAIRHFAVQRKISGSFFEKGAIKYLRLLGIAQSCRFQDKSFFRFLVSEEGDVDGFKDRKRRGRS